MAKITITLEDNPDGSVKMESTPKTETIAKMVQSGHETTSAHGLTLFLFRKALQEYNKPKRKGTGLWLPGRRN